MMPVDMGNELRRTVEVVAAIMLDDAGRVLAVKCPPHKHNGGWEFPGGKMEPGETAAEALVREINEELGVEIEVGELLYTVEWDYPAFHLCMHCLVSRMIRGELQLREHTEARWLGGDMLESVDWLPADVAVLPHVAGLLNGRCAQMP